MTLVRRSDGRVRFLVRENLADGDEDIGEYGDEDDPAILCTDQYSISDGIDESDEIVVISLSITTTTMWSEMLTRTAVRTATVSFATGCEGSEVSQNITYRAI